MTIVRIRLLVALGLAAASFIHPHDSTSAAAPVPALPGAPSAPATAAEVHVSILVKDREQEVGALLDPAVLLVQSLIASSIDSTDGDATIASIRNRLKKAYPEAVSETEQWFYKWRWDPILGKWILVCCRVSQMEALIDDKDHKVVVVEIGVETIL